MLTLEHIDPLNSKHICGMKNSFNEVLADNSYNYKKSNMFVPYRVCEHSAPITFGDMGEFLIENKWVVCEFGGEIWWKESNRIGNAHTDGTYKRTEVHKDQLRDVQKQFANDPRVIEGKRKGGRTPASEKQKQQLRERSSIPLFAFCETTKAVYLFESITQASKTLGIPYKTLVRKVALKKHHKNYRFEKWNF